MRHDPEIAKLARAVASHLDGFATWAVDDFAHTLRLDHPDGRNLHPCQQRRRGVMR